jgi:hypothetical protein
MAKQTNSNNKRTKILIKRGLPGILLILIGKIGYHRFETFTDKILPYNFSYGGVILFFSVLGYLFFLAIDITKEHAKTSNSDKKMQLRRVFFNTVSDCIKEDDSIQGVQFFTINKYDLPSPRKGFDFVISYSGGCVKSTVNTNSLILCHYNFEDLALFGFIERAFNNWHSFWATRPIYTRKGRRERTKRFNCVLTDLLTSYELLIRKCQELENKDSIEDSYYSYYRVLSVIGAILEDIPIIQQVHETVFDNPPNSLDELPPTSTIESTNRKTYHLAYDLDAPNGAGPRTMTEARRLKLEAIEDQLKTEKRTGLLGCTMYGMPYTFNNNTNDTKSERRYYCTPVDPKLGDNVYAVLLFRSSLTISKDNLSEEEDELRNYREITNSILKKLCVKKMKGVLSDG